MPPATATDLRVVEGLLQGIYRAAGHTHRAQQVGQGQLVPARSDAGQQGVELAPMRHALGIAGKTRVLQPLWPLQASAQSRQLKVVADLDQDMAVQARVTIAIIGFGECRGEVLPMVGAVAV